MCEDDFRTFCVDRINGRVTRTVLVYTCVAVILCFNVRTVNSQAVCACLVTETTFGATDRRENDDANRFLFPTRAFVLPEFYFHHVSSRDLCDHRQHKINEGRGCLLCQAPNLKHRKRLTSSRFPWGTVFDFVSRKVSLRFKNVCSSSLE